MHRQQIGRILVERGVLTPEQLDDALAFQHQQGQEQRLGEILAARNLVTDRDICDALSAQLDIPAINLDTYHVEERVLELLHQHLCRTHELMPLFQIDTALTVAMADPLDVHALEEARRSCGCDIETVIAPRQQILQAINHYYGIDAAFQTLFAEALQNADLDQAGIADLNEIAPVIRIVDLILHQAVRERASDIHLEPAAGHIGLRYRVDGLLRPITTAPTALFGALVSRIKVLADMDIAETRTPQDGRFVYQLPAGAVECRVSSFPTIYGENIVLRILDQTRSLIALDELGFSPSMLAQFYRCLAAPYGMVLVTGPTGSGKTTTLYAALSHINRDDKHIMTIEDPVEYRMPLVRQTQVHPKAGLTFAAGLRSILRQDPDVIMLGEMRDQETAQTAFQAALTGHLVFSTLHTNDAPSALTRLLHLGVEPFLVASATICVLAQRLIRIVCPHCRAPYQPDEQDARALGVSRDHTLYRARGCKQCLSSGYLGRTALYELMPVNARLRELILSNAPESELRACVQEGHQMSSLRDQGMEKVRQGVTTMEELNRLTIAP